MDNAFKHHGILGQKWGVRRTPAQLGHSPSGAKNQGSGSKNHGNQTETKPQKSAGKSSKRPRAMSDDELRERINRLNMEEQYENLVARQKQRSTSTVKKLLGEAAESLGRKALGLAVDKFIDKFKSEKGFDINDWKNANVDDMDYETVQKVSKWYTNANAITKARQASTPSNPTPSASSNSSVTDEMVRQRRAAMRQLGTR